MFRILCAVVVLVVAAGPAAAAEPAAPLSALARMPVKEVTVFKDGHAYVDGIPDGNCEIRFPDLDTLEWNVG